jgi:hypothetical protein
MSCAASWDGTLWPTTKKKTLWPSAGCVGGEGATMLDPTAVETRAQDVDFVSRCSFPGLKDRLSLLWLAPPDVPPSPKHAYRSHYVHLGWDDLEDPEAWEHLSDFEIILRLVDFSPLRPVLAQLLGWTSAQGWKPFDPVSFFHLIGWQITSRWTRAQTLRNLHHPRYADLALRFGFDKAFPAEGGLRYWLTTLTHYGRHFDQIAFLYDPGDKRYTWAHNLVNLHYSDNQTDYPIHFQLWKPADLDKIEQGFQAAGIQVQSL